MLPALLLVLPLVALFPLRAPVARPEAQDQAEPDAAAEIGAAELARLVAEIQDEVAALAGRPYLRPVPAATIDRAGFLAFATAELAEEMTPDERAAEETAAKLLGLIPPEMDLVATMFELLEEQVGGFYDPGKDEFFLMSTFTGDLARIILSHELAHALDDQYHDLDQGMKARQGNGDAQFAFQALVEGNATALMNRWTMSHLADLDLVALTASGSMGMEVMGRTPPYLWKPLLGAYMKGAAFLNRTESVMKGQQGFPAPEDVQAAFTAPPLSSEQVLHPAKYWDPAERDDPRAVRITPASLPAGWSVLHENTLGELGLGLVVEPLKKRGGLKGQLAAITMLYTSPAVAGWGGDRYALLGKGEARILVSASAWDAPAEAAEFAAALGGFAAHLTGAAAGLAAARGLEGSGHLARHDAEAGIVRLVGWTGASRAEVEAVLAGLAISADAPAR
ncbi:MAG: hypothetical protein AB1726_08065 [Planctomycetota bacterium]